jgi:hypothetical protein
LKKRPRDWIAPLRHLLPSRPTLLDQIRQRSPADPGCQRSAYERVSTMWVQNKHWIYEHKLIGGFSPSEKYEFVTWDYEILNIWKNEKKMFQTTNQ